MPLPALFSELKVDVPVYCHVTDRYILVGQ